MTTGSLAATLLWVVGSILFSLYVNNFGSYNKTYGALAGVVILMLWLYLTSYIVLLGAEINAESERQTREDTTAAHRPRWVTGAAAADEVADDSTGQGGDGRAQDGSRSTRSPATASSRSGSPSRTRVQASRAGDLDHAATGEASWYACPSRCWCLASGGVGTGRGRAGREGQTGRRRSGSGRCAAGLLAGYATAILLVAAVAGLALVWPIWLAALVVCGGALIVAGVLALSGRSRLRRATPVAAQAAAQSVQDDVATVLRAVHR